jgi:hypothetical protein
MDFGLVSGWTIKQGDQFHSLFCHHYQCPSSWYGPWASNAVSWTTVSSLFGRILLLFCESCLYSMYRMNRRLVGNSLFHSTNLYTDRQTFIYMVEWNAPDIRTRSTATYLSERCTLVSVVIRFVSSLHKYKREWPNNHVQLEGPCSPAAWKRFRRKEDVKRPHFNFQWAINALLYDAKRDIDH